MDQAEYQRRLAQGYPESVARRIATGELPMDWVSRTQRMLDGGYDGPFYHGTGQEFLEFDRARIGTGSGMTPKVAPQGHYFTRDESIAKEYADHYGDDGRVMKVAIKQGEVIDNGGMKDWRRFNEGQGDTLVSPSGVTVVREGENIKDFDKAAFDPEYTGRNILGAVGSGLGILGVLGLAGAPREAQAQGLLEMLMPPTAEAFRAQGAGAGSDFGNMTQEQYNEMVRMLNAR